MARKGRPARDRSFGQYVGMNARGLGLGVSDPDTHATRPFGISESHPRADLAPLDRTQRSALRARHLGDRWRAGSNSAAKARNARAKPLRLTSSRLGEPMRSSCTRAYRFGAYFGASTSPGDNARMRPPPRHAEPTPIRDGAFPASDWSGCCGAL